MTPRRCQGCICILIICKNVGVNGSANCQICWLHAYFSLFLCRKTTFIRNNHQQVHNQVMVQVGASKVGGEDFSCSRINHWNGRSNIDLEPTNHTDWWIWTCNIPQQNKRWDEAWVYLLRWPLPPSQFLYFHHGSYCCHCSLQLDTQKSFTLILFPSLSLSLSPADWQIYYHWFSLSLITTITLGISFLLNTLGVAPCVWLFLSTILQHLLSDCWWRDSDDLGKEQIQRGEDDNNSITK